MKQSYCNGTVLLVAATVTWLLGTVSLAAQNTWQATIHAQGQVVGSAVNQADVVVGVGVFAESLYISPEPPEYTVFMKLWSQTWGGPILPVHSADRPGGLLLDSSSRSTWKYASTPTAVRNAELEPH